MVKSQICATNTAEREYLPVLVFVDAHTDPVLYAEMGVYYHSICQVNALRPPYERIFIFREYYFDESPTMALAYPKMYDALEGTREAVVVLRRTR